MESIAAIRKEAFTLQIAPEAIPAQNFYKNQQTWSKIESYLPEPFRITEQTMPEEVFLKWNSWKIHLDVYQNPGAKAKVILLHGVGGNGRLLSFLAVPLFEAGCEIIAPDLPGYGNSIVEKNKVTYQDWINLTSFLIDQEREKDDRPVFLFGLSAGGMLSYHAAVKNTKVKGIIATNLLDQRNKRVRDASTGSKVKSRILIPILDILAQFMGGTLLSMKQVVNMKAIVNNRQLLKILLADEKSSGTKVPLRFLTSLVQAEPTIEPEMCEIPTLLVHPEKDFWVPTWTSQVFFDRIKGDKDLKILENAGHLPIENPGLGQLSQYSIHFIESNLENGGSRKGSMIPSLNI